MLSRTLQLTAAFYLFLAVNAPAAAVHYVDLNSTSPVSPYTNWATAATNIQNAIDFAASGDQILVTDGTYQTGGRIIGGNLPTNRVAVTKPVTVQSVNGPAVTIIQGYTPPGGSGYNYNGIRCVYLASGSSFIGFTLTNGSAADGGGVHCEGVGATVSNCVITGNLATSGGGADQGTYLNCTFASNNAGYGAGANGLGANTCTMSNCTLIGNTAAEYGGGVQGGTLVNCTLISNSAGSFGGGAYGAALIDCTLLGNTVTNGTGGGAFIGTLNSCTVIGNSAYSVGGISAAATNCIVYYNTATNGPNLNTGFSMQYCCTTPMPTNGSGNITNEPLFVNLAGGDFHLQAASPCINAGPNGYRITYLGHPITNDLDGNPRIVGGTVDIGAYEFQNPTSVISYVWLQQYAFPTDGTADFLDPDSDGMNNYEEWRAGTDPANSASALRLLNPAASGPDIVITWHSVTNHTYYLQRSLGLGSPPNFLPLATNIVGQAGMTSYTDANAASLAPLYYRVGVQ